LREYIFIIDRSGSMQGQYIEMAKKSLILALKSLPTNSKFNIVSFGSNHEWINNEMIDYTNENVIKYINIINTFNADMGGTEVYEPINSILERKTINNCIRYI